MNYDNEFELLIAVLFYMSPQLGRLVPKAQDLVIPFRLGVVEPFSDFHLKSLATRSELVLMRDQKG